MVYTGKIQPAKKKNRSRHTLLTFKMRDYSRYCFRLSFKCDLFVGYYCYHYLLHSFWNPSEMKCGWNDGLEVGLMIWLNRILFQDILSVNRCTICVELFDLWQFSEGMARNQIYTQNMYYMCVIHCVCVCALFDNEIPFEYRTTDQRNAFHIQHLYWFRFVSVCCFYACNFFLFSFSVSSVRLAHCLCMIWPTQSTHRYHYLSYISVYALAPHLILYIVLNRKFYHAKCLPIYLFMIVSWGVWLLPLSLLLL